MDLSTLALKKDSVPVQFEDPRTDDGTLLVDDEGNPVVIYLYGKASEKYRKDWNDRLNKEFKKNSFKAKTNEVKYTAESLWEEGAERLVVCSDRIEGLTLNGKPIDSPEVFKALYLDASYEWLRSQVEKMLANDSNFI